MNWMSTAAQIEAAQLDELNRKVERRKREQRILEEQSRAAEAERRAKRAEADYERRCRALLLATAGMACMVLGVCVMRASAWIGVGLMAAAAVLLACIPQGGAGI